MSDKRPNLQNIPIRTEEGSRVRKSFNPHPDPFLSADYADIESRVLAAQSFRKKP